MNGLNQSKRGRRIRREVIYHRPLSENPTEEGASIDVGPGPKCPGCVTWLFDKNSTKGTALTGRLRHGTTLKR